MSKTIYRENGLEIVAQEGCWTVRNVTGRKSPSYHAELELAVAEVYRRRLKERLRAQKASTTLKGLRHSIEVINTELMHSFGRQVKATE